MSYAQGPGGVRLYYEEVGEGSPIVFVHEFGGTYRSWEPQLRAYARRHRCITFAARGYPPSDVPENVDAYSQTLAVQDIAAVMDAAGIERAHVVGLSMGGFAALHFGLDFPDRARSLVVAGAGYGAEKQYEAYFRGVSLEVAKQFEVHGSEQFAKTYALGASRVQFQNKDPRAFAHFCAEFAKHSALGSANTLTGVQGRRPTIYSLERKFRQLKVPLHMVSGDEDDNCLEPGIFIKRVCPSATLTVVAGTGHAVNLEEPALFNSIVLKFLTAVDRDRWRAWRGGEPGASQGEKSCVEKEGWPER